MVDFGERGRFWREREGERGRERRVGGTDKLMDTDRTHTCAYLQVRHLDVALTMGWETRAAQRALRNEARGAGAAGGSWL